ncbi:hypothetical protein K438DRAFT_1765437 [Mycena galopus ATCC 62051]|nr:hypothetical protein K438DRAFT_1765437 [Mycena galopus ATCC 62051]
MSDVRPSSNPSTPSGGDAASAASRTPASHSSDLARATTTPQGNTGAANLPTPIPIHRPVVNGGKGGLGGKGKDLGGEGGLGGGPHIPTEILDRLQAINGGEGGGGGYGDVTPGRGGEGGSPSFSTKSPLVSGMEGRKVSHVSLAEFCDQYKLSAKIYQLLDDQGFETAAGLFQVSEEQLTKAGFKPGHIGELKRALIDFKEKAV